MAILTGVRGAIVSLWANSSPFFPWWQRRKVLPYTTMLKLSFSWISLCSWNQNFSWVLWSMRSLLSPLVYISLWHLSFSTMYSLNSLPLTASSNYCTVVLAVNLSTLTFSSSRDGQPTWNQLSVTQITLWWIFFEHIPIGTYVRTSLGYIAKNGFTVLCA